MRPVPAPRHRQLLQLAALLLLAIGAMAALRMCSTRAANPLARADGYSQGDTLDIAIEMNPAVYSVRGDSITGRDYSLLRRISGERGVPMKFHPFVPLDHALSGLATGRYDVVVASMPKTSELAAACLLTDAVYTDREVLVQRLDSAGAEPEVTSPMMLGGREVWIPHQSTIATRIRNLASEIGDTITLRSDPRYSSELLVILVAQGRIPRAVVSESVAAAMAADYPQLHCSMPASFTQFQCWAVSPGREELRDSLNAWINTVK